MAKLPRRTAKRIFNFVESVSDSAKSALVGSVYPGRGDRLPPVLLFAQPKSGSTYIHRALRQTLRVPFMRVGAGGVFDAAMRYSELQRFAKGNAVCREHLPARRHLLDAVRGVGIDKVVLHVRDPRYSIVSWTKMIDRFVEARGMPGALLTCEMTMPDTYASWEFPDRLKWQIENYMPRQVEWIEKWLALAEEESGVEILITKYEEFSEDPRAYLRRLLTFYQIPFEESWIKLPDDQVGKNNIFSEKTGDRWAGLDGGLKLSANNLVPAALRARFDWKA
jgi:hypothetical protein